MVFLDISGRRWKKIKLAGWLAMGGMVVLILPAIFAVVGIHPNWSSLSPIKQAEAWAARATGDNDELHASEAPHVAGSITPMLEKISQNNATAVDAPAQSGMPGYSSPAGTPGLDGGSTAQMVPVPPGAPAVTAPPTGGVPTAIPPAAGGSAAPAYPDPAAAPGLPLPGSSSSSPGLFGSTPAEPGSGSQLSGANQSWTPAQSGFTSPAAGGRAAPAASAPPASVTPPPFSK